MNNIRKNILLIIAVILVGLGVAGGTYAWFTNSLSVTDGTYNVATHCFLIDYNINNTNGSQDITGTMFPSGTVSGGLSGRVGLKINDSCKINGKGTLKLHVNSGISSKLTTGAASYCENRKTLEPISGITTESACTTAGGRWRGYGDAYCESKSTYERLTAYTSSNCSDNGGTWKSGGSPLKYAVYENAAANGTPLSKGYITSNDIGKDITIYDDFDITSTQKYYYIFIWLDGYLTDSTYVDLPFSGYISADAIQNNQALQTTNYVYTVNMYDLEDEENSIIILDNPIPGEITTYESSESAIEHFNNYPYFLRQRIQDDAVSESYVGFVVTDTMAANNDGMRAGTYFIRGLNTMDTEGNCKSKYLVDNEVCLSPYHETNRETLLLAFGSDNCSDNPSVINCEVEGLSAASEYYGFVHAGGHNDIICLVNENGHSYCDLE